MQLSALFRLGFPSAPYLKYLTSLHIVTRWLVLQKARHHTHKVLWPVVGTRFQVLFHSPPGVLFTFPSRYFFTIGHQVVFSLGRWSSLLPTRFHVSRGTLDQLSLGLFSLTWLLHSTAGLSRPPQLTNFHFYELSSTPEINLWFGLFPFRSPLLRKSNFSFSSFGYLDVSVPRVYLPISIYSIWDTWGFPCEFPHSDICGSLSICDYPQLFAAYRVLHRLLVPRHSPYALCILTNLLCYLLFYLSVAFASS